MLMTHSQNGQSHNGTNNKAVVGGGGANGFDEEFEKDYQKYHAI
jgi:hypothetical protein